MKKLLLSVSLGLMVSGAAFARVGEKEAKNIDCGAIQGELSAKVSPPAAPAAAPAVAPAAPAAAAQ